MQNIGKIVHIQMGQFLSITPLSTVCPSHCFEVMISRSQRRPSLLQIIMRVNQVVIIRMYIRFVLGARIGSGFLFLVRLSRLISFLPLQRT